MVSWQIPENVQINFIKIQLILNVLRTNSILGANLPKYSRISLKSYKITDGAPTGYSPNIFT